MDTMSTTLLKNAREIRSKRISELQKRRRQGDDGTGGSPPRPTARTSGKPPIVSPSSPRRSSSWEVGPFPLSQQPSFGGSDRSVVSEIYTFSKSMGAPISSDRSVVSESNLVSDDIDAMPSDEIIPEEFVIDGHDRNRRSRDDDISSLGGVEDAAIHRLTVAVRNGAPRPQHLTHEEQVLWEAIQSALALARQEAVMDAGDSNKTEYYEAKYKEAQEQLRVQSEEQMRSLRAIHSVLADVTAERDRLAERVKSESSKEEDLDDWEDENAALKHELETKQIRICSLERQVKGTPVGSDSKVIQELREEIKMKNKEIEVLKQSDNKTITENVDVLKKELHNKTSALENAKMIIASLESASGSLAVDFRSKLKAKEEDLVNIKAELAHTQKRLDTLAKELRESQRSQANKEEKLQRDRRRRIKLASSLERHMASLRAYAVVLESTNDTTTSEKVTNTLSEAILAIKGSIDEVDAECMDSSMDFHSFAQVKALYQEIEQKSNAMKSLEEEVRKQKADMLKIYDERDAERSHHDNELQALQSEIQILREQHMANLEIMTRRERELVVLRDSLKVDDDDVGYISDDATDTDDDHAFAPSSHTLDTSIYNSYCYGRTQAEALTALLAHSSSPNDFSPSRLRADDDAPQHEIMKMKSDLERLSKELKAEKENLVNAKMIISSLENANRTKTDDLRSQLQECHAAIASLLEKSMESETSNAELRSELEKLKREKHELSARYVSPEDKLAKMKLSTRAPRQQLTETID